MQENKNLQTPFYQLEFQWDDNGTIKSEVFDFKNQDLRVARKVAMMCKWGCSVNNFFGNPILRFIWSAPEPLVLRSKISLITDQDIDLEMEGGCSLDDALAFLMAEAHTYVDGNILSEGDLVSVYRNLEAGAEIPYLTSKNTNVEPTFWGQEYKVLPWDYDLILRDAR